MELSAQPSVQEAGEALSRESRFFLMRTHKGLSTSPADEGTRSPDNQVAGVVKTARLPQIRMAALRRNSDAAAERLRREIPLTAGRLAAEAPGSVFDLTIATDSSGMCSFDLGIEAGHLSDQLVEELSAVLLTVAELAEPTPIEEHLHVWPVVSSRTGGLGFDFGSAINATALVRSVGGSLVSVIQRHPGCALHARLTALDSSAQDPAWAITLTVRSVKANLPILLRADLRAALPGLELGPDDADATELHADSAVLPGLFPIPVAGELPLAGVYTGAAAPIPAMAVREVQSAVNVLKLGQAKTVGGTAFDIRMPAEERLRHMHIVGQTGTGKSSLLAGIVNQIANTDEGALVLDPHSLLIDRIVAELPESARRRTWVIRCGDHTRPVPLNPLAVDDPIQREIVIDDIGMMFQALYDRNDSGIVGPRFRERVAMGLRLLVAEFGSRASLIDVPMALSDRGFIKRVAEASDDNRLKAWAANEADSRRSNDHGYMAGWVNSKFEAFSSTTAMRAILGSGMDAFDMASAMDRGQIILVDLSKGVLGESAAQLLGYLYLAKAWKAGFQRKTPRRTFNIVVDEASSVIAGALTNMLSEGRKFGLAVVIAHQFLEQLDSDLRPAIDGNVATTVAFRCAVGDTGMLLKRFGGGVPGSSLVTLPDMSAIILRSAIGLAAQPHTLIVDHNQAIRPRTGPELRRFERALTAATDRQIGLPVRRKAGTTPQASACLG